jgi:hypothetical protein
MTYWGGLEAPTPATKPEAKWTLYRRVGVVEMRPYVAGEDLFRISVSVEDDPPNDMGMIARNPDNHDDQWYVARAYFEKNTEPVTKPGALPEYEALIDRCNEAWAEYCVQFKPEAHKVHYDARAALVAAIERYREAAVAETRIVAQDRYQALQEQLAAAKEENERLRYQMRGATFSLPEEPSK